MMLDTGLVYVNGVLLAPCEGDNVFAVEREYRDIPFNGMAGKTKGLKRITRENATITVHPKGLTQTMLKYALPGVGEDGDKLEGGGRQVIDDANYIDNVMLVGTTKDGETKVIKVYNALADNGLTITASEDSEAVLELVFSAHYDPDDLTAPIYSIEESVVAGTSTVTFTITGGDGAATVKFAGRTRTESAGTVVFEGVAYGTNRPYEVHEDDYVSVYSSVTVSGATTAVAVTMVAV
jgi:hypothetical protein